MSDSLVLSALQKFAEAIVMEARKNASWSSKIPGAISSLQAEKRDDGLYQVVVTINLKKAPEAGAFEFGSGLHATQGRQATYKIAPKTKKYLAFEWDKFDPNFRRENASLLTPKQTEREAKYGNLVFFRFVNHPGVVAKPYMIPAIRKTISSDTDFNAVVEAIAFSISRRVVNDKT